MSWFASVKTWFLSWFTDVNKLEIIKLLQGIAIFIDYAKPIVEHIDKILKPLLKGEDMPIYDAILTFLGEYSDDFDKVVEMAEEYAELPLGDMLANIAMFCLKAKVGDSVSSSILRLAIELAYNLYKVNSSEKFAEEVSV